MTESLQRHADTRRPEDSEEEPLASKGEFSRLNRPEVINRKGLGT